MMNIFARRLMAAVLLLAMLGGVGLLLGFLARAEAGGPAVHPAKLLTEAFSPGVWSHVPGRPFPSRSVWDPAAAGLAAGVVAVLHTVLIAKMRRSYLHLTQALVAATAAAWALGAAVDLKFSERLWSVRLGALLPLYLMLAGCWCAGWELLRLTVLCRVLKDAATEL